MTVTVTEKTCPRCGETKPASEWHRKSSSKDGLHSYCKLCSIKNTNEWKQEERERMGDDAFRAYQADIVRRWRARNPGWREVGKNRSSARNAAQRRLKEAHPDEYESYYDEECRKRGLR